MRVTKNYIYNSLLQNLRRIEKEQMKYYEQLSSKKQINRASDDPVGTGKVLDFNKELKQLETYKKNVNDGDNWLQFTEASLDIVNEELLEVLSEATRMSSDSYGESERDQVASLVQDALGNIIKEANKQLGTKYLFGGTVIDSPPFEFTSLVEDETFTSALDTAVELDYTGLSSTAVVVTSADGSVTYTEGTDFTIDKDKGTITVLSTGTMTDATDYLITYETENPSVVTVNPQGTDGRIVREIEKGEEVQINFSGEKVFNDDVNIFQVITDFKNALVRNDGDAIRAIRTDLEAASNQIIRNLGTTGLKIDRFSSTAMTLDEYEIQIKALKSSIEDADIAEAAIYYESKTNAYESALQASAKVIQLNLLDYLA